MNLRKSIVSLILAFSTAVSFSAAVHAETGFDDNSGYLYEVQEQHPVLPEEYSLEKKFDSIDAMIEAKRNPNLFLASSEAETTLTYMTMSCGWHYADAATKMAETDAAAEAIVAEMDPTWSELTKVIYVNDYLTFNCEYDLTYSKYCAYNCLVEKTSVCQGYAEAFWYLMYKLGIDCRIVTSSELNHAWNIVKVDGQWYQVDATWNDPVPDTKGNSAHIYMLISDALIRERGHDADDWKFRYEGGASAAGYCTSTKYDEYFWQNCNKPIIINGDNYYYMIKKGPNDERGIAKADKDNNITIIKDMKGYKWYVLGSKAYWVGNFSSLCFYNDSFVYNSSYSIYTCDINGENEKEIYTLTDDEKNKGSIYKLSLFGNVITYSICENADSQNDIVATGIVVLPDDTEKTEKVFAFVNRLYSILLDRAAEPDGLADWTNRLTSGKATSAEIVYGIAASPEFQNKGLTNEETVERLYLAMLDRASDADGKQYWVDRLNVGMSVNAIINGFSCSDEFGAICADYSIQAGAVTNLEARDNNYGLTSFVSRMYTKAMGRPYDVNGLNDWTNRYLISTAESQERIKEIAYGFIFSQEFTNKNLDASTYLDTLYLTFFDREADEGGKADWLCKLADGMTREEVMYGFVGSQECINLIDSFDI